LKEAFAMPDDASKPDLKIVPPPAPENVFDDVEALRKIATLKVSRRVVPVNVAVRKTGDRTIFISLLHSCSTTTPFCLGCVR
jgi:hypothetical protein